MEITEYIVYAIQSEVDGRIYVGFTENVERRLKWHNQGKTKSTKGFRPWKLLYTEIATDRTAARKREVYLKGGSGKEFLKNIRDKSDEDNL
ncbi:MAG: GIY-YIG nuclease family protein [Bacteroidales bacterium]|nr:GIY-YIG nuclease family protein [Bacteroidales bacterium]MCF8404098.1 GIY-YIG nuclease family protein [Bacteroidales bacterium]